MKRPYLSIRTVTCVLLLAAVAALSCGCRNKKEARSTVAFHTQSVRTNLGYLRNLLDKIEKGATPEDPARGRGGYSDAMRGITAGVRRALEGLPQRVQKKATTNVEQRKAAAAKALALFESIQPSLNSLRYDKTAVLASLDQIDALLAEVDQEGS